MNMCMNMNGDILVTAPLLYATCNGADTLVDRTVRRRKLVVVPNTKTLIKESPGFHKKDLSEYKFDPLALCEFGCTYCSSNTGNYLRISRSNFAKLTEEQIGE